MGYLAYDNRFLYVGFDFEDPNPSAIRSPLGDHDNVSGNSHDLAGIFIDTLNSGRTANETENKSGGIPIIQVGGSRSPLAVAGAPGAGAVSITQKNSFKLELGPNDNEKRRSLMKDLAKPASAVSLALRPSQIAGMTMRPGSASSARNRSGGVMMHSQEQARFGTGVGRAFLSVHQASPPESGQGSP